MTQSVEAKTNRSVSYVSKRYCKACKKQFSAYGLSKVKKKKKVKIAFYHTHGILSSSFLTDHHELQNKVPRDRTTLDVADYNNCHDIKWEIKVDDWLKIFMQLFKTTFHIPR